MALSDNSSNKNGGGDNQKDIICDDERRKHYTVIGIVFTILGALAITYFVMTLYGSFLLYIPLFDNEYDGEEFDGYLGGSIVLVCCSWGEELADGELTYFIGENTIKRNGNGVGKMVDSGAINAINKAIQEWDSKVESLTFTETSERRNADIEFYFREGRTERAGVTKNYYDYYGFITKSYVMVSDGAFGFGFSNNQIEQISKHEIGHVLGLGHANFDSLMAAQVNHGSGAVSDCEINAVYRANEWWFERPTDTHILYIRHPTTEHVECK